MAIDWNDYQEEAAALFRAMGLEATTNEIIQGARTKHAVDVVVRSNHAGFEITWLVECKYWKSPVSKLHVLALREIVSDVGADRGILLCEAGFQSGAIEAANLTNVQTTSIDNLRVTAGNEISAMRLRELYDRVEICRQKYWELPKRIRIATGLRPDVGEEGFSGTHTLNLCSELLTRAFRGIFPFSYDTLNLLNFSENEREYCSAKEVVSAVKNAIEELERRLQITPIKNH